MRTRVVSCRNSSHITDVSFRTYTFGCSLQLYSHNFHVSLLPFPLYHVSHFHVSYFQSHFHFQTTTKRSFINTTSKSKMSFKVPPFQRRISSLAVVWLLMGGLLHLVQRGGTGRGRSPPRPLLALPNATAHPLTAGVPITVLLYCGPLLCDLMCP